MIVRVMEAPGGRLNEQHAKIRRPASAPAFSQPSMDRLNWLLSQGASCIYSGAWLHTSASMGEFRIYHTPSENCKYVMVAAVIEQAGTTEATFSVTPDDGAGTAFTWSTDDTTARSRFGIPSWHQVRGVVELVDTSVQYHAVVWANAYVRHLTLWELPRSALDTATDEVVAPRAGVYAGLWSPSRITDHTSAGVPALLQGCRDARDAQKRSGGWAVQTSSAWTVTPPATTAANLADAALSTSGFGFKVQARSIRAAETSQPYSVWFCAKASNAGVGARAVLASAVASDSVEVSPTTTGWDWYKASTTLDIACDEVDTLVPKALCSTGTTAVYVRAIMWSEA